MSVRLVPALLLLIVQAGISGVLLVIIGTGWWAVWMGASIAFLCAAIWLEGRRQFWVGKAAAFEEVKIQLADPAALIGAVVVLLRLKAMRDAARRSARWWRIADWRRAANRLDHVGTRAGGMSEIRGCTTSGRS